MASRRHGGHGCHRWVPLGSESLSGLCCPHPALQKPLARPGWSTAPPRTGRVRALLQAALRLLAWGPEMQAGRHVAHVQ